nr:immunoglobulin heavy chain junction region [Mus musculus]
CAYSSGYSAWFAYW